MRIALISDMHGHGVALQTVLKDISQQKADQIICLGDVATIGPQPKEVIDTLKQLDCICIRGNHDEALLEPERAAALNIAPPLIPTLEWTAARLTADDLAFIRTFYRTHSINLSETETLLCYHGSPRSNLDNILPTTPIATLNQLLYGQSAVIMAGGHTHTQMMRPFHGRLLLNPGSIGHPFKEPPAAGKEPVIMPRAEYAIIHYDRGAISVELKRLPFDREAFFTAVRQTDHPLKAWWLSRYQ